MQGSQADGAPRAEARGNSYVDQWVLGCVREESFERSLDETDASWVAGLPDSRNTSELEDVLSPLSLKGASDGDGIYDEIKRIMAEAEDKVAVMRKYYVENKAEGVVL